MRSINRPTNVYIAYPNSDYQIEVFDPSADAAQELVEQGAITKIERKRTPAATGPIAVTRAGLVEIVIQQRLHAVLAGRQLRELGGKAVGLVVDAPRLARLEALHIKAEKWLGIEPIGRKPRLAIAPLRDEDEEAAIDADVADRAVQRHVKAQRAGDGQG